MAQTQLENQPGGDLSDAELEGVSGGTGGTTPKGVTPGVVGISSTAGAENPSNSGLNPNLSDTSGSSSGSMGDLQSSLNHAGIDTTPPDTAEDQTPHNPGASIQQSEGNVQNQVSEMTAAALAAKLAAEQQQALLQAEQQQQQVQNQQLLMQQQEKNQQLLMQQMNNTIHAVLQTENELAAGTNSIPGGKVAEELVLQDELAILEMQKLGIK